MTTPRSKAMSRNTIIAIMISMVIILSLIALYINNISTNEGINSSNTKNVMTNTSLSTTISLIPTNKDFNQLFNEYFNRTIQLYWQGYDILYEQYLLLKARYYYSHGYVERAWDLIYKVGKLLEKPLLAPEIDQHVFIPVDNSVNETRAPTINDFLPIGLIFGLSPRGYLVYPRNDLSWKLSCYIIVAVGKTSDGKIITYQGRFPMMIKENPFKPRFSIGNKIFVPNIVFAGPIYVDNTTKYGGPTIYEYDISGRYMERLTYIVNERTWIHEIVNVMENKTILFIKAKAIGAPMWLGNGYNEMFIHGVYAYSKDFDMWLGFWDVGEMTGYINIKGKMLTFKGFFVFDRASHRPYNTTQATGMPLAFSCIVLYQKGLTIMITNSSNLSPLIPPVTFEHELRLNIYDKDDKKWITITLTNFNFTDNGGLQPSRFSITLNTDDIRINIVGKVIGWWPQKWPIYKGTWWNPKAGSSWGRAFIYWSGEIIYKNKVIEVNALGAGEFTRYTPVQNTVCNITCTHCNCYE